MQNAGIDWTTGDIVSGFDGTWPMLDDQIVVMYDQVRTQNMRRSIIPVMLNGTSGYLVMMFTSANPDGVIAGFTEGYDANGLAVRGLTQLKAGDELIPLYPMLYDDGSDSDEFAEDTFDGRARFSSAIPCLCLSISRLRVRIPRFTIASS